MSADAGQADIHTSDPATTDKDVLEREIEESREKLVDSVDAIVERIDPKQVTERHTEQIKRDAHRKAEEVQHRAQEVQHRVQQQAEVVKTKTARMVEEQPERVAVIGAGSVAALIALWWVAARRRDSRQRQRHRRR